MEGVFKVMNSPITNELMHRDRSLVLHNEGEWSKTLLNYYAFNDGGIECETGEFLYGLVRLLKPLRILETGTHHGVGASYMALALQHNNPLLGSGGKEFGAIDTIEFLPENFAIAQERFKRMSFIGLQGEKPVVNQYLMDAAKFKPEQKYQLILLDTEPQTRFAEFERYWNTLDEGGFLFIHDLHRHMHQIPNEEHGFAWPYGEITEFIKQKVASDEARPFHLPTPRGLTGFYKVSSGDYKWQKN